MPTDATDPAMGSRLLYHFTHIDNLVSVADHGLSCDETVRSGSTSFVEVGNQEIKQRRRERPVPIPPGGTVGDYVPFYFAPRSPMLYAIHRGNVPGYTGGQDGIVYLVSSIDRVVELELPFVFTDRNAALAIAAYSNDLADLNHLIDWNLMTSREWFNTDNEPDRRERRMAEFLVHRHLPWSAILGIATHSDKQAGQAQDLLASVNAEVSLLKPRPDWYFR